MMRVLSLLVFLILLLQSVLLSPMQIRDFNQRIVGGQPAAPGQFPYQISLLKRLNTTHVYHTCGGSIIRINWIMTAAHCVIGADASQFLVMAGTNIIGGVPRDIYPVSKVIWHQNYNQTVQYSNDIALLKTESNIIFKPKLVQSIALATTNYRAGTPLIVSGWGQLQVNVGTNLLQWLSVNIENINTCRRNYNFGMVNPITQFCTNMGLNKGVCMGDSGGPLVHDGKTQVGIVSFGVPCALGSSDVHTKVSSYISWINSTIDNN